MSKRRLLAGCLIVCAIAGLTNPQVLAADAPVTATPLICTGLVPDDAFAAIVLYPRRVLANEALAKFDVKGMVQQMGDRFGISPLEIEQAVVLIAPPVAGKNRNPQGGGVFRSSKPIDQPELVARAWKPRKAEEAEIGGHKFFRPEAAAANPSPGGDVGIYFVDERTFISADLSWLPKMLAAKDAKSALISALAANDPAADATIIFTNTDAAKAMIAGAVPAKSLAGPLKPVGDLPELLQAAKLSIRTNPEISLKLTLLGKDEDSADKMAQMIKSFQQLGQAFLPALQAQPGDNMPADQHERAN